MIECRQLQKVVDQRTVVDIASLTVQPGEVAAVVGPAGSGKSALFDLLIGRTRPTAGTVRVAGLDPTRDRESLNHRLGVLFAQNALYERLSARDNLAFHCRVWGLPVGRASEVLELVGLADHADVPVSKLSPGLSRRLALGRALLHRPPVLLLMEPLYDCDAASRVLMIGLIRQLAEEGCAILILSSEATGLAGLCGAIHELEEGRITRSYLPQEEERQAELPFRIPARLEDRVALLNPADVLYAAVEGGRTWLYTDEERFPTQYTLTELEGRLSRSGFFRAHRSYLVNLQRVKEVAPYTQDSFTLVLDDQAGTDIPLSKAAARELRELLDF